MRALRFDGRRLLLDPARPEPAPGPGEALIRPTRLAIGEADLAVAAGQLAFTGILGHEFVGIVEKVHPTRDDHTRWEGKRVVGSINLVCGACDLCRAGLSNHCRARRILGLHGHDGCFADRFTLPIANLAEVPKAIDDDRAVFAESLAAAAHTAQLVRIESKPYITILGDNSMGLLTAQLMARLNASVRVLGSSPTKFSLCEKWGVKHRHAEEAGRRQDQDVVVECTGTPAGLALATQLVRPRGKIIVKSNTVTLGAQGLATPGATSTGASIGAPITTPSLRASSPEGSDASLGYLSSALDTIVQSELEVIGARCGRINDAIDLLASGKIDVLSLVTRRAKLADAVDAFQTAAHPDQIKVLLDV